MTRLKAWFISLAGLAVTGAAIHSGVLLATGDTPLAWSGALLSNGAFLAQMTLIMMRLSARTSSSLPALLTAAVGGAALATGGVAVEGAPPLALAYAALGLAVAVAYTFWYSRLGREASAALEVGAQLPVLRFENDDGTEVTSEHLLGTGPLLLMFYRGNWCPFCNAQIREIAERYRELEERGCTVALVAAQSHANTKSIAERFDIPARFLVDVDGSAAKKLGIFHEGGLPAGLDALGYEQDVIYPTVVITDRAGVVLFADQTDNYRVRPEPETFLAVLDGRHPAPGSAPVESR